MKTLLVGMALVATLGAFAAVPKNVILFIGDGMSVPQRMVADEFSRQATKKPLAMNAMPYQATTRTCSANSLVTDSAAAATAIACGVKANNGAIGVTPDGESVDSCAVAAKMAGKKVGICSSVTITHATPAGFYGHRKGRGDVYGLAIDLANSGFDFFAGGGLDVSKGKSKKHKEYKTCGDAYKYAEKQGYQIIKTKADFLALKPDCGKILTRFTNGPLEYAINVKSDIDQPSIAEITKKAIEILDNPDGFFLMVEGGRIDWAGHANDAATNLRDVLALDEAVRVALAFQEKSPDTLVLVTGDHETGGLSMGFAGTGYAIYPDRLAKQTMCIDTFEGRVKELFKKNPNLTFEETKPLLTEAFGFMFQEKEEGRKSPMTLSKSEVKELADAFTHDSELHRHKIGENPKYDGEKKYLFGGACRLVMSHKAGLGWSSGGHTAMPVLTSAKGPGAEKFTGFIENTDISKIIKSFYAK